jgi:hypothetical protein
MPYKGKKLENKKTNGKLFSRSDVIVNMILRREKECERQ